MNVVVLLAVILFVLMVLVGGRQGYAHFFLYSKLWCALCHHF